MPWLNPVRTSCRYNCPANCLYSTAKVWGTLYYDVVRLAAPPPRRLTIFVLFLFRHFEFVCFFSDSSSNPVSVVLRSITGWSITTGVWWKCRGKTVSLSSSKPRWTASSLPGRRSLPSHMLLSFISRTPFRNQEISTRALQKVSGRLFKWMKIQIYKKKKFYI